MKIYYIIQKLYTENRIIDIPVEVKNGKEAYDFGADENNTVYVDCWQGYALNQYTSEELSNHEMDILKRIKNVMPDVLRYHATWNNMSDYFFKSVKALGIPVIISMSDTMIYPNLPEIKLFQVADCFVVYDSISNYLRFRLLKENANGKNSIVFAGGNQFSPVYLPNLHLEKTFDVGMLGSIEGIRSEMIEFFMKHLSSLNISFYSNGGCIVKNKNGDPVNKQSEQFLTHEQYVEAINKTKINIVSQTVAERVQIKCKIFEYMACGAFALVDRNPEYEMLIPSDVIVYYDSLEDCLEKIKYYLANPAERELMAKRGNEWFTHHFSAGKFWNQIYHATANRETLPILPQVKQIYDDLMARVNVQHELYVAIHKLISKPDIIKNTRHYVKKLLPGPVKRLIRSLVLS